MPLDIRFELAGEFVPESFLGFHGIFRFWVYSKLHPCSGWIDCMEREAKPAALT